MSKMHVFVLMVVASGLLTPACASKSPDQWHKSRGTNAQFTRDSAACEVEVSQSPRVFARGRLYNTCMTSKGWSPAQ